MTGSFRFWPEAAAVARQLLLPSRHHSETPDTFLLISFKKHLIPLFSPLCFLTGAHLAVAMVYQFAYDTRDAEFILCCCDL